MSTWQLQEAKTKLSQVLEEAEHKGPQIITRHGKERAVVISIEEYKSLTGNDFASRTKPDEFLAYLLNGPTIDNFEIERDRDPGREIDL